MAKVRAYGADATLLACRETSYGVAPASGYRGLDFKSTDLSSAIPLGDDPLLGRGRNAQAPYRGLVTDEGSVDIPLDVEGTGWWLTGLFGAPSTTGSGPYTHVWQSGADAIPSYTLEIGHPQLVTPVFFRHTGVVFESLAFEMGIEGPANGKIAVVAQGETSTGASVDAAPSRYALKRFSQGRGSIRKGGIPLAGVTAGRLARRLRRGRRHDADAVTTAPDPLTEDALGPRRRQALRSMSTSLTGLPIVSRKTSPLALFVLIIAGLGLGRPLHAEAPGIEPFFGRYEGRAIVEGDDETTMRDLDFRIEPAGAPGDGQFRITWSTVIRRRDGEDKRKSYSILFQRTTRAGIFASAMRTNMFGNAVPLDPLKGDPFVWCRIAGRTLTVYALLITDDGGYDLQVYDRTLRDGGLDLKFTRFDEGEPSTVVTALLEKVGE